MDAKPRAGRPQPEPAEDAAQITADTTGTSGATRWVGAWEQGDALRALQEILALAPQVSAAVASRLGLNHSDLTAMQHLMGMPMGPGELSRRIGLTPAATTVAVDRLAARGHVRREADPDDGRRTRVVVTDSGREDVYAALLPMFTGLRDAAERLDDAEAQVVQRFLAEAAAAMRRLL